MIGIDEAQFFEDLYEFCCNAADHDGKTVVVAGLDGDYLRCSLILMIKFPISVLSSLLVRLLTETHTCILQKELWFSS